jgi:hypothetical protein
LDLTTMITLQVSVLIARELLGFPAICCPQREPVATPTDAEAHTESLSVFFY